MSPEALRIAIGQPEAWALLTDAQSRAIRSFIDHEGNVSAVSRSLGVTRQAVMKHLRLAGKKFLAFAEAMAS